MSKKELIDLIELAWAASSEARILETPMVLGLDLMGNQQLNTVRWNTYLTILAAIVPKNMTSTCLIENPKEPWQE